MNESDRISPPAATRKSHAKIRKGGGATPLKIAKEPVEKHRLEPYFNFKKRNFFNHMTFHISLKGVNNTEGTTAKFNGGGTVKIDGSFQNSGDVQIDVRANLEVLGNVVNAGTFSIKDYVVENQYQLFEKAIADLQGDAKSYLGSSYQDLKSGNVPSANNWFKKFAGYIKDHPELITSSVQVMLQLFYK